MIRSEYEKFKALKLQYFKTHKEEPRGKWCCKYCDSGFAYHYVSIHEEKCPFKYFT